MLLVRLSYMLIKVLTYLLT